MGQLLLEALDMALGDVKGSKDFFFEKKKQKTFGRAGSGNL